MKLFTQAHQYGQTIPKLTINGQPAPYPVVNEREIRAAAGMMFLLGICVFFITLFTRNYIWLNLLIPLFFVDFFLKTIISPEWSIFGRIAKIVVKNQKPEYVGAIQKRFAWSIGLFMSFAMIWIALVFQIRGIIPFTFCSICLIFMWMESTLGICVGCKIYYKLIDLKIIKTPKYNPACPGGICNIHKNSKAN